MIQQFLPQSGQSRTQARVYERLSVQQDPFLAVVLALQGKDEALILQLVPNTLLQTQRDHVLCRLSTTMHQQAQQGQEIPVEVQQKLTKSK